MCMLEQQLRVWSEGDSTTLAFISRWGVWFNARLSQLFRCRCKISLVKMLTLPRHRIILDSQVTISSLHHALFEGLWTTYLRLCCVIFAEAQQTKLWSSQLLKLWRSRRQFSQGINHVLFWVLFQAAARSFDYLVTRQANSCLLFHRLSLSKSSQICIQLVLLQVQSDNFFGDLRVDCVPE